MAGAQGLDRLEVDRILAFHRAGDGDHPPLPSPKPAAGSLARRHQGRRHRLIETQLPRNSNVGHAHGSKTVALQFRFDDGTGEAPHEGLADG